MYTHECSALKNSHPTREPHTRRAQFYTSIHTTGFVRTSITSPPLRAVGVASGALYSLEPQRYFLDSPPNGTQKPHQSAPSFLL